MVEEKIINFKGVDYIVSSDGHVYSTKNHGRGKYHKELKQREDMYGYMAVTVGENSHRTVVRVHKLVAQAFLPPKPDWYYEIDHIDRNRKNNNVSNLQWITHKENVERITFEAHSVAHSGTKNGRATVAEKQVVEMRYIYECQNKAISEISKIYNVPYSTVFNIVKYKTWKNVN